MKIQAEIFADGNDIMTEIWLKIIERRRGEAGLAMRGHLFTLCFEFLRIHYINISASVFLKLKRGKVKGTTLNHFNY